MRLPVLIVMLAMTGCGPSESPPARTNRSPAPATFAVAPDSELTRYLTWHREWTMLTNRHWAELQAVLRRIDSRYSLRNAGAIAEDPDLLSLLERHRGEMQPLMTRAPRGPTAAALDATLPGIGQLIAGPEGMTYVPGRNEAVLAAARAKHGEEFVRWVLAHEDSIVSMLRTDR